ncbi:MAG: hypothetical protein L6R41_008390, partial [Letrouitia leprolyta]
MPTDEHVDQNDWKGGLTAFVQIGKFQGAAMVLKQLGIILPGYRSGAPLQFRGSIPSHFITKWNGKCRFAFDHTTKDSVRRWVEERTRAKAQRNALKPEVSGESDMESDDESETRHQFDPDRTV